MTPDSTGPAEHNGPSAAVNLLTSLNPHGHFRIAFPWPDQASPFEITAHLAEVDGRKVLIGLDVRSFRQTETEAGIQVQPVNPDAGYAPIGRRARMSLNTDLIRERAIEELAARHAVLAERSRRVEQAQQ